MALPAKRIPESVAHLDVEIVAAALIRHNANIGNAARVLGVPSGDLRKLVLADQRLADAALEAVELRLDDAEANLCEALHCDDPRRRDAVSMFMLRNVGRAAKRGYAVAASAASLEVGLVDREPRQIIVSWRKPARRSRTATTGGRRFERDGQIFVCRAMTARGVTTTLRASCRCRRRCSSMPLRSSPSPSTSTSRLFLIQRRRDPIPAVRYERERIDAWIRNIASSTIRSPPACAVASQLSRGRIGRRRRTARQERAFIGPVTPNGY